MAQRTMDEFNVIYTKIMADGFSTETLQMIDNLTTDIQYGRKNFNGFTLPEHAGLCKGGAPLIGASIVAGYARRSLTTGGYAESSEGGGQGRCSGSFRVLIAVPKALRISALSTQKPLRISAFFYSFPLLIEIL